MRQELTDRIIKELQFAGNFIRALAHPLQHSDISYHSGTVTHHEEQGSDPKIKFYGLRHELKLYGVFLREVLRHPKQTSYINPETLEIRRE